MTEQRKISQVAKRRGFFFQTAQNHGSVSGLFTLGPNGAEMYRNIVDNWKSEFVQKHGFQEVRSPNILPESVFEASGHLDSFSDAMIKCEECGSIHRADKLIEREGVREEAESLTQDEMKLIISEADIVCPTCDSDFQNLKIEDFNLMFDVSIGSSQTGYLRPETAQGTFCDFPDFVEQSRQKPPYGFAQIGNAYRNEISPRRNLIRKREFSQAELEVFVFDNSPIWDVDIIDVPMYINGEVTYENPVENGLVGSDWMAYYMIKTYKWLTSVGIDSGKIAFRKHKDEELAHYATECWDAEVLIHNNWTEVVGIADRESHDLKNHEEYTGVEYSVFKSFDSPREVEETDIDVDMSVIGPKFKNNAQEIKEKLISKIKDEEEIAGQDVELTVNEDTFTIESEWYEISTQTVEKKGEKVYPKVMEPAFGIERVLYAILSHNFDTDIIDGEQRNVFRFEPDISPYDALVTPSVSKDTLTDICEDITTELRQNRFNVGYEKTGNIGRRYRRHDEIGTPFAVTVDHQTIKDDTVTVRERDSTQQTRVHTSNLLQTLEKLLDGAELEDI